MSQRPRPEPGSVARVLAACAALAALAGVLLPRRTAAQNAAPFAAPALADRAAEPSNRQLADPALERRVNALLGQMTLAEKLGQLVQYNDSGAEVAQGIGQNPNARVQMDAAELAAGGRIGSLLNVVGARRTREIQRAAVERSRLHIPVLSGADILHGYKTIYPIPLGLAATWDPDLVASVSRIAAVEATTAGVRWFYSPMVDISRDPRWGRTQEGAGEDAFLGAAMARAYVRGYQGESLSSPASVAASVKHFAAYGAAEAGREYNTTDMSLSRLEQVYLPPYKAAVGAGAATIMSAFNALNGVPSTANSFLLGDVLRGQWRFNGLVVSDYTAIMELVNHGVARDPAAATEKALAAGVDIDMMSHFYDAGLPALIRSGRVPMAQVDEAVRRVLRVKFALGLFEHPYPEGEEIAAPVAGHRPAVREAAEESIVLLQNHAVAGEPVLPLREGPRTIALIGPLGDDGRTMNANTGVGPLDQGVITVRQALEERARRSGGQLLHARGTEIEGSSEQGFGDAVEAARRADVVVMALGESSHMSGEGGSRAFLDLPGNQEQLLEAVAATGRPVVLLVFSGRPLVLDRAAQHAAAVLAAWFPGVEAGAAIANILYGDVAPSGRLPMSFPRAVGQEPFSYNQLPTGRPATREQQAAPAEGDARFVSRYTDVPNDALFPFGFGLSYTEFAYSGVSVSRSTVPLGDARDHRARSLVRATATVKNTGSRAATEVVQCYVRNLGASLEQPVRSLEGFQRVRLAPGESRQVSFDLGFPELSFYDNAGRAVMEPTHYTVWIGGSSLAGEHAEFDVVTR